MLPSPRRWAHVATQERHCVQICARRQLSSAVVAPILQPVRLNGLEKRRLYSRHVQRKMGNDLPPLLVQDTHAVTDTSLMIATPDGRKS